jgi:hypothetical protein
MRALQHVWMPGIVLLATAMANGDKITWDGETDDDWGTAANWNPNGVPTADDRAIIPDGSDFTVVVSGDFTVDSIEIGTDVTLTIETGNTLTLENDDINRCTICPNNFPDHHHIGGVLEVEALATLEFVIEPTHVLMGDGHINGQIDLNLNLSQLSIDFDVEVINELANSDGGIRGNMTFHGATSSGHTNGAFTNYGSVV